MSIGVNGNIVPEMSLIVSMSSVLYSTRFVSTNERSFHVVFYLCLPLNVVYRKVSFEQIMDGVRIAIKVM